MPTLPFKFDNTFPAWRLSARMIGYLWSPTLLRRQGEACDRLDRLKRDKISMNIMDVFDIRLTPVIVGNDTTFVGF